MVVPLIGYVDRFSGRPGECIAVKVSSQFDAPYRADMVRIRRVRIAHGGSTRASQMPKYRRSVKVVSCSRNHLDLLLSAAGRRSTRSVNANAPRSGILSRLAVFPCLARQRRCYCSECPR